MDYRKSDSQDDLNLDYIHNTQTSPEDDNELDFNQWKGHGDVPGL